MRLEVESGRDGEDIENEDRCSSFTRELEAKLGATAACKNCEWITRR